MTLISNIRAMEQQMLEMHYDARRAPLGKLTSSQVKAGYAALKEISECVDEFEKLRNPPSSPASVVKSGRKAPRRQPSNAKTTRDIRARLLKACNQFYTRIPHDFG